MHTLPVGFYLLAVCCISKAAVVTRLANVTTLFKPSQFANFMMVSSGVNTDPAPKIALNRHFAYGLWQEPRSIPFRLSSTAIDTYDVGELRLITEAMWRISNELGQCVQFRLHDPIRDNGRDHLLLAKTMNDGTITDTCQSFPGRALRGANGQGQKLIIHNGRFGCLNSAREVAKYLVNVLGLRNEFNRPDRATSLQVFEENVLPELRGLNLLRAYSDRTVDTLGMPFDYSSITMQDVSKYAVPGTQLFAPLDASISLAALAQRNNLLSQMDCVGITTLYAHLGCNPATCGTSLLPGVTMPNIVTGSPIATPSSAASTETPPTGSPATPVSPSADSTVSTPSTPTTSLQPGQTTACSPVSTNPNCWGRGIPGVSQMEGTSDYEYEEESEEDLNDVEIAVHTLPKLTTTQPKQQQNMVTEAARPVYQAILSSVVESTKTAPTEITSLNFTNEALESGTADQKPVENGTSLSPDFFPQASDVASLALPPDNQTLQLILYANKTKLLYKEAPMSGAQIVNQVSALASDIKQHAKREGAALTRPSNVTGDAGKKGLPLEASPSISTASVKPHGVNLKVLSMNSGKCIVWETASLFWIAVVLVVAQ